MLPPSRDPRGSYGHVVEFGFVKEPTTPPVAGGGPPSTVTLARVRAALREHPRGSLRQAGFPPRRDPRSVKKALERPGPKAGGGDAALGHTLSSNP